MFLGEAIVGSLAHDAAIDRYTFAYDERWSERSDAFALSPALPLKPSEESPEAHGTAVRQFFENLLPEGEALDVAAAVHRVSKANVAGLLRALGGDMPGALIVRAESAGTAVSAEVRRALPLEELSARIRARPQQPFAEWDGTVRLSVAGYQDKLGVLVDGDAWFLVDGGGLASTHLLKPEPIREALAGLTTNEFACLRLAQTIGIPVTDSALVHVPEPVLMVTRFDRRLEDGRVVRRPVIDGCQALGLPASLKYERPYGSGRDVAHVREGASYPRLFSLIRERSAAPLVTTRALLRLAIFNVLVGNVDAHAKNLTFFVSAAGLELAPAYDLVSHFGIAADVDANYAFAIGDAFTSDALTPFEWALFAQDCALPSRLVSVELGRLAERIRVAWPQVAAAAAAAGGSQAVLARIGERVLAECGRQVRFASEIARVPKPAVRRAPPAG